MSRCSTLRRLAKSFTTALYKRLRSLRTRNQIGKIGERVAARLLRRQGYTILERNFRAKGGEIDIIASKRGTLHFVEVKTRSANSAAFVSGIEAIDTAKALHIERAAEEYLRLLRRKSKRIEYDAVIITERRSRFWKRYQAEWIRDVL